MILTGGCHCGAIVLSFETTRPPEETPTRACDCSFCRRHGAVATSDPAGRLEIRIKDPEKLSRYRFGELRTADFLLCRECGVFLAALLTEGGKSWATLNVNALAERERFPKPAAADYSAESREDRIERRKKVWTPASLREG